MLTTKSKLIITSLFTVCLSACGGGGGDGSKPAGSQESSIKETPSNTVPVVNAGDDYSVRVNTRAVMSAEASDADGNIQSYKWEKTSHVAGEEYIELIDSDKKTAYFETNFYITEAQEYTFTVTVTDNNGATSSDEVKVTVLPVEHVDIKLPDNINQARLTLLNDDTVLVTGGCKSIKRSDGITGACAEPSLRAFVLNLKTETLNEIENINAPKFFSIPQQSSLLLSDGRVLLSTQGAWGADGEVTHNAEIYDPKTQQFTPISPMSNPIDGAMPVALENGSLAVFSIDSVEIYEPASDSWETKKVDFKTASSITAALPNNRVLLVGGVNENGLTYDSYIYDHNNQTFTEIAPLVTANSQDGVSSGVYSNGGGDYRRVDLDDNSFCLLSHSNIPFSWPSLGTTDVVPIRFDLVKNEFVEDNTPCEKFWNVGGYSVNGETFTNGHVMPGAAHVELKSDKVWISQQINDVKMRYNEDCDCYIYKEPMTIRIIKH